MLSILLALLFLSPIVHSWPTAQHVPASSKRDFQPTIFQGLGPEPFDLGFDARSPLVEGGSQWFRLVNGGPGAGVSPGEQVGWRLTEDPASEIVFYMTDNPVFWTVTYTGSDENAPSAESFANVGAAVFTASVNTSATSDDSIWTNSTGAAVVPWRYNVAAFNGCQDGRVVVFTTVDANGTVTTTYGVDGVTLDIPSLPFNLTINFEDSPDDVTSVSLFATDSHTYKVGTGPPQPTVPAATFDGFIFWCDVD